MCSVGMSWTVEVFEVRSDVSDISVNPALAPICCQEQLEKDSAICIDEVFKSNKKWKKSANERSATQKVIKIKQNSSCISIMNAFSPNDHPHQYH